MSEAQILSALDEHILTITLNRPERLNAFTEQMRTEIMAALDRADADDEVRAVIFTGAGRGYCAGADLGRGGETFDYAKRGHAPGEVVRDGGGLLSLRLYQCRKPVIGAINGPAVGVGATMQLPMDVRIASERARFGFVFSRRGVAPEACSSWFLPRLVGVSQALDWAYSGRVFDAAEARSGGLVSEVTAHEALLPRARELAKSYMTDTSAVSVAMVRAMFWRAAAADHPMAAHRIDSRAMTALGAAADAREGIAAFLEKRPPDFAMKVSGDMPEFYPWWTEPEFD